MASSNIPEEIFYFFAKKNQSVDELIRNLYKNPDEITINHFKAINSHFNKAVVKPGQMVIVTPAGSQQCSVYEADLA